MSNFEDTETWGDPCIGENLQQTEKIREKKRREKEESREEIKHIYQNILFYILFFAYSYWNNVSTLIRHVMSVSDVASL